MRPRQVLSAFRNRRVRRFDHADYLSYICWVNIGQAAKASGLSERMIRYFEKHGVIPEPARSGGGYRAYCDEDVSRMRTIALAQNAGFSTGAITRLIAAMEDSQRDPEVEAEAMAQLDRVEEAVAELRDRIDDMVDRARSRIGGGGRSISDSPHIEIVVRRDEFRPSADRVAPRRAELTSAEPAVADRLRDLTPAD